MKILIAEDEFVSRAKLQKILNAYGQCYTVVNGHEALESFRMALEDKEPFDLVCLDIMMPELDGQKVLQEIRRMEESRDIGGHDHVKVIMITALSDAKNVMTAFMRGQCEAYLHKPVNREKLVRQLERLGLI